MVYGTEHPPLSPLPEVLTPPERPFAPRQVQLSPPPLSSRSASPPKALPALPGRAPRPGPLQMPAPTPSHLGPSLSRTPQHQRTMSPEMGSPPPNHVWRMPSFRRDRDRPAHRALGVDSPGGPTPDERVSRYGQLRAYASFEHGPHGNGHLRALPPPRPLTVAERLFPTLELARHEREQAARKAKWTNILVNIAMTVQILLGALTTGLSAAVTGRQISIVTSIFGGLTTIVASYLARVRGSGEPEGARARAHALDHFIREVENVVLDRGWRINMPEHDSGGVLGQKDELDVLIEEFRRRFEEIMGNLEERPVHTKA